MSSPSTPETAALAPSTPERETTLLSSVAGGAAERREHHHTPAAPDVSGKLASLTLEEEEEQASVPSASPLSLVTLVSADGHRLCLPRRVAEESGTVRQLLLSRDDDDASDITIPLPAVRKRELVSIFEFCARQLAGRDELERIRQREEAREEERQRARGRRRGKMSGGDGGGAEAAAAESVPPAGPSAASLSLSLRARLAADAAAWAASAGSGGGSRSRGLLGRTLAANFLDVPFALAACADAVAAGIRGRTPAEIRARFGIAPDLSRAEEEAIKADCAWAFDCC